MRWIVGMAEVDSGKGQDGSGEDSVCNRKKKCGSGMGVERKNIVFKLERGV